MLGTIPKTAYSPTSNAHDIEKQVSTTLGPSAFSSAGELAGAEKSAYPALSGYIKSLSTPWGQQKLIQGNRNALTGAVPEGARLAGNTAALAGLGPGAIAAARMGVVQKALSDANAVQDAYATPQGQAQAAQSISQQLAALGQIPSLENILKIQQQNLAGQTPSAPTFGQTLAGIGGSVLGGAASAGMLF